MNGYTWEYICTHKKETKRLLGINFEQLEQLIEQVKILQNIKQEEKFKKNPRLIAEGGGRSSILSLEEQLILTLVYFRDHLTFQLLGLMFQVSESTAHNIFGNHVDVVKDLRNKGSIIIMNKVPYCANMIL